MTHQSHENSARAESSTFQTGAQALPIEPGRLLFPPVMNGYAQWGKQGFNICGGTEKDRLYHIDIHSGYSRSGPLGSRPGVVLHQGMDTKTPILAAAGYDSQFSARLYSFNNQTAVLMPSLLPAAERTSEFDTEQMPATVRGEQVVFSFFVEVDHGKERERQKFEWRKFEKGKIATATEGGFELVRVLSPCSPNAGQEEPGASSASLSTVDGEENEEVVALLIWRKLWPTFKHNFTLQLLGKGQTGELGDRWALMVVITAIRIWALRVNGKTKKGVIATGQKLATP
ncbi:hypothetical protein B0J18DRAFT_489927 [Chaetomium sp. MPI-SDFR-AT-0129]|nr:hypothetical protein B0J18DRAFT_489927 [Chaetomium sp. MPI-SDFR-AT-0129]